MKKTLLIFACALIFASVANAENFFVSGIAAQTKEVSVETLFTGDAEPKAVELPLPEYPREAKVAGIQGTIIVPVLIDEEGNAQVYLYAAFGPYPICRLVTELPITALRDAATQAAKEAKFAPAVVDGKPVKTRGKLIYTFLMSDKPRAEKNKPEQAEESKETISETKATPEVSDVKGNIVNGKAISLPKPGYPAEARSSRVTGTVRVRVLIDEKGNVYSAEAVSGHRDLSFAAETAACEAKFSPTLLSGEAVRVTGIITYNFVP